MNSEKRKHKILIIDDDKDILELLAYNLDKEGYEVETVSKSTDSLNAAKSFQPDLIILDIMMPKINGIEVCRQLRESSEFNNTYIFFLTAKSDKELQIEALETGGDDFIQKITGLRALTHKISTVLKRKLIIRKCVKEIHLGDLTINRRKRSVAYKGKEIVLSESEFEIIYFFAQNPKKIISRDNLLNNIWGPDVYLLAKTLDTYLMNVADKLGTELIKQVREGKYKLEKVS
ncbi:response regulator transcription factor [Fulvivirga lutea]|uniref:Response regulator transcription factor n=1 Tax=Fulvivirga lutea TaxID=2810512 RepID=A0A974WG71_9BACT|nr:response regulator transcription factor [Fulvivirga lutea]QSE96562.1 response regulator transcription factor [Fulvivirga lutea]